MSCPATSRPIPRVEPVTRQIRSLSSSSTAASVQRVTTVILARHGETDWNRNGIWQGHGDPPLNDLGRRQARQLAARLEGDAIDALYSSDMRRARETAGIVAAPRGLAVVLDPDLREMDVGSWTGLTLEQIGERFPGMTYHDGESREAFDERVLGALYRIAAAHDGGQVLAVAHGGVVRALDRHVIGEPRPVLANCATVTFEFENGSFTRLD